MKKLIILFSAAIALVACAKVESEKQEVNPSTPVTFNVKVASTDTKAAAKSDWANGDVIYLVFKGITTKYLSLTYNSGKWNVSSSFVASDFSGLGGDYEFTAVHFPITVTPSLSAGTLSFTADGKPVYTYYMKEEGAAYTFDGAAVSMTVNLTKADGYVQFHVPGIESGIANYSFAANDVQPVACSSIDASTGAIAEVSKNVGAAFGGFLDADGAVFSAKLTKSGEQSYTFLLTSTEKVYSFTKPRSLDAGTFYRFEEITDDGFWTTKATESMDYVDLGLPSGLKWGRYHLGANNETDPGTFYMWGEIEGDKLDGEDKFTKVFNWDHYRYCSGWTYKTDGITKDHPIISKYNATDGKTRLEAIDDAATNALGTGWRMPTLEENLELIDGCTWEYIEGYSGTTRNGWLGTSKYNGATIFLPMVGNGLEPSNHNNDNIRIYPLSSDLKTSETAYCICCKPGSGSFLKPEYNDGKLRCQGHAIFPVYE